LPRWDIGDGDLLYSGGVNLFMGRKAFNFYKSYFEVFRMLESDEDKLQFITALLEKQF